MIVPCTFFLGGCVAGSPALLRMLPAGSEEGNCWNVSAHVPYGLGLLEPSLETMYRGSFGPQGEVFGSLELPGWPRVGVKQTFLDTDDGALGAATTLSLAKVVEGVRPDGTTASRIWADWGVALLGDMAPLPGVRLRASPQLILRSQFPGKASLYGGGVTGIDLGEESRVTLEAGFLKQAKGTWSSEVTLGLHL